MVRIPSPGTNPDVDLSETGPDPVVFGPRRARLIRGDPRPDSSPFPPAYNGIAPQTPAAKLVKVVSE